MKLLPLMIALAGFGCGGPGGSIGPFSFDGNGLADAGEILPSAPDMARSTGDASNGSTGDMAIATVGACGVPTCSFSFVACNCSQTFGSTTYTVQCKSGVATSDCACAINGVNLPATTIQGQGFACDTLAQNSMAAIAACGASSNTCGNRCVDLTTDLGNCGRCGNACGAGQCCTKGQCVTGACQTGTTKIRTTTYTPGMNCSSICSASGGTCTDAYLDYNNGCNPSGATIGCAATFDATSSTSCSLASSSPFLYLDCYCLH